MDIFNKKNLLISEKIERNLTIPDLFFIIQRRYKKPKITIRIDCFKINFLSFNCKNKPSFCKLSKNYSIILYIIFINVTLFKYSIQLLQF